MLLPLSPQLVKILSADQIADLKPQSLGLQPHALQFIAPHLFVQMHTAHMTPLIPATNAREATTI